MLKSIELKSVALGIGKPPKDVKGET